jgi:hypothetical protein
MPLQFRLRLTRLGKGALMVTANLQRLCDLPSTPGFISLTRFRLAATGRHWHYVPNWGAKLGWCDNQRSPNVPSSEYTTECRCNRLIWPLQKDTGVWLVPVVKVLSGACCRLSTFRGCFFDLVYSQIHIDSRVFVRRSLQTLFTVKISLNQLWNTPLLLAALDDILCRRVHQSFLSTKQYNGPTCCMRTTAHIARHEN